MKDLYFKICDSIVENYNNKHWGKLSLEVLILVIAIFCGSVVLALLVSIIISNIEKIVLVIGSVVCFSTILISLMPKRRTIPISPQHSNIPEYDTVALEHTYKIIRKAIFGILIEISGISKLRKPVSLSQMDAPTHFDIVAQTPVYHLLVLKESGDIDIDSVDLTGILQYTLEQKLENHELDGISQTSYFYNGQTFPFIMIDNVRDLGNYVQIDVAIASDRYCKYRENRLYNSMANSGLHRFKDSEF